MQTKQRLPDLENKSKQTTAEQKTLILMFQSHLDVVRLVCRNTSLIISIYIWNLLVLWRVWRLSFTAAVVTVCPVTGMGKYDPLSPHMSNDQDPLWTKYAAFWSYHIHWLGTKVLLPYVWVAGATCTAEHAYPFRENLVSWLIFSDEII